MTEKVEIACAECGTLFLPLRKDSKHCHESCRALAYRKAHREDAKRRSKEWHKNNPDKRKAYLISIRKAPVFANCRLCGEEFRKNTGGTFCSVSCRAKHRRQTKPEWYKASYQKHREKSILSTRRSLQRTRQNTPWKLIAEHAKWRARKDKRPFTITDEWLKARWTGKCELTGIPFDLGRSLRGCFSPSIDQIIPGAGYTPDNTRFVLWAINAMKGNGSDDTMYRIAKALITHAPPP